MRPLILISLLALLPLGAPSAHALEITVATGAMTSQQFLDPVPPFLEQKSRLGLVFGGVFNFGLGLGRALTLEPGILFLLRRTETYDPDLVTPTEKSTFRAFHFPLLLRVSPFRFFSIGAGPYYTQGFSRVSSRSNRNNAGEASYDERKLKKVDFGAEGSVRIQIPLAPGLDLSTDVRYLRGMNNIDNTGAVRKELREALFMIGLTVGTN